MLSLDKKETDAVPLEQHAQLAKQYTSVCTAASIHIVPMLHPSGPESIWTHFPLCLSCEFLEVHLFHCFHLF